MKTKKLLNELTERINNLVSGELGGNVTPFKEYTAKDIRKGNTILVNPDDMDYTIEYLSKKEYEENQDLMKKYFVDWLDYSDMPFMRVFIY